MSQLIKRETAPDLVEQVYRALLDAISDGSLAPGTRITQEDIAAFENSPTTRSAIAETSEDRKSVV